MKVLYPPGRLAAASDADPHNGFLEWEVELDDDSRAFIKTSATTEDETLRIVRVTFDCLDPTSRTFDLLRLGEFRLHVMQRLKQDPTLLMAPHEVFLQEGLDAGRTLPNPDHQRSLVELLEQSRSSATAATRRLRRGPRKGRSASNPDHYRDVAIRYLELLPVHGQRVIQEMADQLGYSSNTVSTWVRRAREEGWLSKGTQGKAGGEPGPKLVEWMKEQK